MGCDEQGPILSGMFATPSQPTDEGEALRVQSVVKTEVESDDETVEHVATKKGPKHTIKARRIDEWKAKALRSHRRVGSPT